MNISMIIYEHRYHRYTPFMNYWLTKLNLKNQCDVKIVYFYKTFNLCKVFISYKNFNNVFYIFNC